MNAESKVLRVVHIGVARRGEWPLRLVGEDPRYQSVALVDVEPAALEKARSITGLSPKESFRSLEEALERMEADVAVVCSPTLTHADLVRRALEAGLHVLVEKGMTNSLATGKALVNLAREKGRVLCVSQNYRYRPVERALKEALDSGRYGSVAFADLMMHRYRPEPRTLNYPGSVVWDMACHHFDLFYHFFGPCQSVAAQTYNAPWSLYRDDAGVSAILRFSSGVTVTYLLTHIAPKSDYLFRLHTEKGTLTHDRRLSFEPVGGGERIEIPGRDEGPSEQGVLNALYDYVEKGIEPGISGRHNLQVLAMCQACLDAADRGTSVAIERYPELKGEI